MLSLLVLVVNVTSGGISAMKTKRTSSIDEFDVRVTNEEKSFKSCGDVKSLWT